MNNSEILEQMLKQLEQIKSNEKDAQQMLKLLEESIDSKAIVDANAFVIAQTPYERIPKPLHELVAAIRQRNIYINQRYELGTAFAHLRLYDALVPIEVLPAETVGEING